MILFNTNCHEFLMNYSLKENKWAIHGNYMLKKKTGSLRSKSDKIYKKIYQKAIECEILKTILKDFEPTGDQISQEMLIFARET